MVLDPGIALKPDNIVAQTESNIIYGLSQSIKERVTLENGEVQQSNFHDYEVFRQEDIPNIEVKVMPQGGILRGIGELGCRCGGERRSRSHRGRPYTDTLYAGTREGSTEGLKKPDRLWE